jgi:hypothetical protein
MHIFTDLTTLESKIFLFDDYFPRMSRIGEKLVQYRKYGSEIKKRAKPVLPVLIFTKKILM